MKKSLLLLILIYSLCLLSACGGSSSRSRIGAATHFSAIAPATATAGGSFSITVTALDAANNAVSGYAGTVHFTSTDGQATLPANSMLTNGAGSFPATLKTLGSQTITATDGVTASITGTSNPINVKNNQNALTITSGAPPSGTVGTNYNAHLGGTCKEGSPNCVCIIITGIGLECRVRLSGFPLVAAGGLAPYNWSWTPVTGSSLPPGLVITTVLTSGGSQAGIGGTPATAGNFDVVVAVADSSVPPAQASATYTVTINSSSSARADDTAVESAPVQSPVAHQHYKLIDLGTFGGPFSIVNAEPTEHFIDAAGTIVGGADTSLATPVPDCYNPVNNIDCYISHAFAWRNNHLKDLGTLPGGNFSYAEGTNNLGQIAGVSENDQVDPASGNPQFHAVLWDNGRIRDLGTLGGTGSFATSINNQGQVMGVSLNDIPDPYSILGLGDGTTLTQTRGFLWRNGKMHDLGSLGGPDTFAIFLNQRGQVAGMSDTSYSPGNTGFLPMDPFIWENGKIKDLGNFGGSNPIGLFSGFVSGLNDSGEVTGTMTLPGDQVPHAFLWHGEKLSDLGTLGGSFAVSYGLNELGEVVGLSGLTGDSVFHAFLWRDGRMTDLGTVDDDACSTAQNANSKGQVVGSSQASDGMGGCVNPFTHAFLWENGGPSVDLNKLIPSDSPLQLTVASFISDHGEIVGGGSPIGCTNNDTCNHVYVLIPCDENHPHIEGCDYSSVDDSMAATSQAPAAAPMTAGPQALTSTGAKARIRNPLGTGNRRFAPRLLSQ